MNESKVMTVHHGVECSVCKVLPIRGKRYKCMICNDFQICQNCENDDVHAHPVIRMTSPIKKEFEEKIDKQQDKYRESYFKGNKLQEPQVKDVFIEINSLQ